MTGMENSYFFKCIDCGKTYKKDELEYVCPACAGGQRPMEPTRGVLKVVYSSCGGGGEVLDSASLRSDGKTDFLRSNGKIDEFHLISPLKDRSLFPPLKVGPTPLYRPERLCGELGLDNLYLKDDTVLPTGSFKDRASSLVVAKARELKKDVVVCASTGNAATALAGMCASVGMRCVIFVPAGAPPAKLTQIAAYGADLVPVEGTYDDAFELSLSVTREFGWYNRNTAYNPFTIEGKKSAALEICEQLGKKAPDKILIPTGDGVILAGIYKGFWDLKQLGLVEKLPQLIAVQAEGSCVITKMFEQAGVADFSLRSCRANRARTIADSISVTAPRNANWAVKAIKETKGFGVTVQDKEIISAIGHLAKMTGIFAEPAASAPLAGAMKLAGKDLLKRDETIVLLITGTGLKDIPSARKGIKIRKPINPTLSAVKKIFSSCL